MFGNKEVEAGIVALNIRLDNMQKDISEIVKCMQGAPVLMQKLDAMNNTLQDIQTQLAEQPKTEQTDSPFKTKEGLFNYKHRKPVPEEK